MSALTDLGSVLVETGELRPYPLDNLRERGHWVARVDGPSEQYGVERAFIDGATRGRSRYWGPVSLGAPSWILRASVGYCDHCGAPSPVVELVAATGLGWAVMAGSWGKGSSGDLLRLWESGPPGDDPAGQVAAVLDQRGTVYAADLEVPF